MQFKTEMIEAIKAGRKTQTRRLCKPGERLSYLDGLKAMSNARVLDRRQHVRYRVGGHYSMCPGRGQRRVGLIRLSAIRLELVAVISEKDSDAEGFHSRDEFLGYWRALYPHLDPVLTPVWVLSFQYISEPEERVNFPCAPVETPV